MSTTKQQQHFANKLDKLFEDRILPAHVSFRASSNVFETLGDIIKTEYGFLIRYGQTKTVATSTTDSLAIIESLFASDPETAENDSLEFALFSEDYGLVLLKDQWDGQQLNFLKQLVRREGEHGILELPYGVNLSMMADSDGGPDVIWVIRIKLIDEKLLFECEDDNCGSYKFSVDELPESACYYIIDQYYELKE